MSPEFNVSADLNSTEFLKALSEPKPNSTKLVDIVNSVFKASTSNTIREAPVTKKIKVKHNALRDSVLTFRDLVLHFNSDGIAETEAYNKGVIEIEQMYRPNCFTFIEEAEVKEDITVDQFLEESRAALEEEPKKDNTLAESIKGLEEFLEKVDPDLDGEQEEITKEQTPKKRGRKGK